jgi:hypothetical protein
MTKEIDYVELLKLSHEKLGSQSDMIAELEKELSSIVSGLFSENELAILKLEQQAKGIDMSIMAIGSDECKGYLPIVYLSRLYNELTSQAKELKEQK